MPPGARHVIDAENINSGVCVTISTKSHAGDVPALAPIVSLVKHCLLEGRYIRQDTKNLKITQHPARGGKCQH